MKLERTHKNSDLTYMILKSTDINLELTLKNFK